MSTTETRVIVIHNPPHRRKWSKDDPPMMRIVLLGSSVSENSDVGNFILGRAAFDSEAPPDVVERVTGRLKDRHVIIINSPQLLQTNISDHQITQTVRECVHLSDPGPHVIVLLLKHEPCSAEDQECVEKVLHSFSESVYQHTMVISTQEPTETSHILQNIIQKCANRHFSLQRSSSPEDLLLMFEDIEKMNDGRHLDCASMEKQHTERFSESVKLNLVVCGSDKTLKSSISEQILQTDRRSDVDLQGHQISLVELPALIGLSEEEVMRQTLRCVSLCHPGVHVFLLIIPDAPLNNEDKAEIEEIQRIFSSRINKHIMILIKQDSEHQTAELNEETQSVIERFGGRHHFFGPKTQVSTLMENIEQMLEENKGEFFSTETFLEVQMKKLVKYEEMKKKINPLETQGSMNVIRKQKLNLVLCGSDGLLKMSVSRLIKEKQDISLHGCLISLVELPALFNSGFSEEQLMHLTFWCVSLLDPGVHAFLLIIPDAQLNNEDKAEMEEIQRIFSSRVNKHIMVLRIKDKNIISQLNLVPSLSTEASNQTFGSQCFILENSSQVPDLLQDVDNMVQENRRRCYTTFMCHLAQIELERNKHIAEIEEQSRSMLKTAGVTNSDDDVNGGSFYTNEMFQQVEKNIKEEQERILKEKVEEIERKEEELRAKYEAKIEEMKKEKERERQEIQNELRKTEEEFKRREEEIKKETDDNIRKELQRKLKEQQEEFEEENKRKEKYLAEQQQNFIKHLEERHEKEKLKLQKKIQHETREQAEHEYHEKLEKEVAKVLKDAEEKHKMEKTKALQEAEEKYKAEKTIVLRVAEEKHRAEKAKILKETEEKQGIEKAKALQKAEEKYKNEKAKALQDAAERHKQDKTKFLENAKKEKEKALEDAEKQLPQRAILSRDWNRVIPVVGGTVGGFVGAISDYWCGKN
ncbi:hypothetical protein QQF64_026066 [Cirrhinus molitorella]|uniref:AIG1-type G domain-containing protein n=1 Tax=Cirrhinus molitorella TaxID=172907 RepID=A0ABR3NQU7_9TELE